MLKICLVFWKSEPRYAYKRYAHTKHVTLLIYPKFPVIHTTVIMLYIINSMTEEIAQEFDIF